MRYKTVWAIPMFLMLIMMASALGVNEITQDADRLNYWTSGTHIVTVNNTGTDTTNATITSAWTVSATSGGCSNIGNVVECILAENEIGTYSITSDASVGEYATTSFQMTTNNTYTSEKVTFVRMKDTEIFRTLVEYGRGRGNYFYDSGVTNTKGIQCSDLPANTEIQLNYLHKIYPIINNYLNVPSAIGTDLKISCYYPNATLAKQHLATDITFAGDVLYVNYSSDWLKNSWEKVFFLVQDFNDEEYNVGDSISINCSQISYYLPDANGYVSIDNNGFVLNFKNSTPIVATAVSVPTEIGTGSSEVEITYTIINTENIVLSSSTNPVTIDIQAPTNAKFIGVKGEMWGTALDKYRYEVNSIAPLANETITLVARYETTGAGTQDLSKGVSVSFVPCWQVNAYNPLSVEQSVSVSGTIIVNATAVTTKNLMTEVETLRTDVTRIEEKIDALNTTLTSVQSTVVSMENTLNIINETVNTIAGYTDTLEAGQSTIMGYVDTLEAGQVTIMGYTDTLEAGQTTIAGYVDTLEAGQVDIQNAIQELNVTINDINATSNAISSVVNSNAGLLTEINATTQSMITYLQTEIFNALTEINLTTQDTNVIVRDINTTANSINVIVTGIEGTVNTINTTVNTISGDVTSIGVTVDNIDTNVQTTLGIVDYINSTRWGNITAQMLYNQLSSLDTATINTKLTGLSTQIRQLSEFEEESIYLITDSITEGQKSYTEAMTAMNEGNTEVMMDKLQESLASLTKAEKAILDAKAQSEGVVISNVKSTDEGVITKVLGWIKGLFGK